VREKIKCPELKNVKIRGLTLFTSMWKISIMVLWAFCLAARLPAADKDPTWECFKATEVFLRISPESLSYTEVKMINENSSTISLITYRKGPKILEKSKVLDTSFNDTIRTDRVEEELLAGPFIGESVNFIVINEKSKQCHLVCREIRLDRLLVIPLINLGDAFLQAGPGKVVTEDSPFMALTKGWIAEK
jgi:hypothetical protein